MEGIVLRTISIDGRPVIVIKRKIRKYKPIAALVKETEKYVDPSHESEKPKNPLNFVRASFAKGFRTKPIWENIRISPAHLKNIFGEPTRICHDHLEWVIKIPNKQILKIVVTHKDVTIHGFEKTQEVEKWVSRLMNT